MLSRPLERAPELRTAGGPVDVRGDALEFSRELGLLDGMRVYEVHMTDDTYFVDADGVKVAGFPHAYVKDHPDDLANGSAATSGSAGRTSVSARTLLGDRSTVDIGARKVVTTL